jgi:heptosyltransferase-2
MSLPAVQELKAEGYRISILCPPKLEAFWSMVPGMDAILFSDENPAITAADLRPHHFDAAIIYPHSLRTALEAWLARIPIRIGYKGHNRRWMLTHVGEKPAHEGWRHHAYHYLDLLSGTGLIEEPKRLTIDPLPQPAPVDRETAPYLALCPGAEYGPAKRWQPERFAETANRLAQEHSLEIILLGSPGDQPACEAIEPLLTKSRNLAGRTTMEEFMGWIAHATFVLCNDSGSMHLAAAFNRPGAAIFGSTEPAWTGPLSDSIQPVREHVPCSPCFLRECPLDFRCMEAVTTEKVLAAARSQFN